MPVNTLRRIIMSSEGEYEAGFQKWVEHFCRMANILGCRAHFFANEQTLDTTAIGEKKYGLTMTDFC